MSRTTSAAGFWPSPAQRRPAGPEDYRNAFDRLRRAGGWTPLPWAWCKAMGLRAAAVVAHILNVGQKSADRDGWVMFTERYLQDGIGISPAAQEKAIDRLAGLGVVDVQHRGRNRVRHVRLDLEALRRAVAGTAA